MFLFLGFFMKKLASIPQYDGSCFSLYYKYDSLFIQSGDTILSKYNAKIFKLQDVLNLYFIQVCSRKSLYLIDGELEPIVKPVGYVSIKIAKKSSSSIFNAINFINNPFNKRGYHFTLFYDVNYLNVRIDEQEKNISFSAVPLCFEILAENTEFAALVIVFNSNDLTQRSSELHHSVGLTSDYNDLKHHITIKYISKDKSISLEDRMKELKSDLDLLKKSDVLKKIPTISMKDERWRLTRNQF